MRMLLCLFAGLVALAALPSVAQPAPPAERVPAARSSIVDGALRLDIVDLSPRFADFWAAAQGVDPDRRWDLWQRKYGFAAVPPTPEGERMAREMLEAAWPRYASVLPAVRAGASGLRPPPMQALREVAELLGVDGPLTVQLTVYVGQFDGNAFTARADGVTSVAIPVEMDEDERARLLRHEMTHAVHIETAGLEGGWERSIAETVLAEGLAMRAVAALLPGQPDAAYVEHRPDWFARAQSRADGILAGLEPVLEARDGETVMRFTMGSGSTGLEREAYLGGWLVVGELLRQGHTFSQLARIPSSEMPRVVRDAIAALRTRTAGAAGP